MSQWFDHTGARRAGLCPERWAGTRRAPEKKERGEKKNHFLVLNKDKTSGLRFIYLCMSAVYSPEEATGTNLCQLCGLAQ